MFRKYFNPDLFVTRVHVMKKIYITSLHLKHGGIEKMVCNLSNLFIEMNYSVEILCVYNFGEPVYHLDNEVKITYLIKKNPKKRNSLRNSIKKFNFKKVIYEFYNRYSEYYLYKKIILKNLKDVNDSIIISTRNEHTKLINTISKSNNKLIAQLHCDHTQFKGYSKDIKYNYSNIDYLLLLNDELRSEVEAILFDYNEKVQCLTVPNFVTDNEYKVDIKRKKQIISVGRLSQEKGFGRLLLIWKKFIVNNKDYILKIIGGGEEKESLIQLAQSLDISDSIVFTGYLSHDKVVEEIRKSKLYVMTSLHEAFPLVIIEALSQGTPVIAYDVRVGPRSIIKDGYNGFLVKDNDVEVFSRKLEFLLKEENVYNKMSKNSIISSTLYSEENLKDVWLKILS